MLGLYFFGSSGKAAVHPVTNIILLKNRLPYLMMDRPPKIRFTKCQITPSNQNLVLTGDGKCRNWVAK